MSQPYDVRFTQSARRGEYRVIYRILEHGVVIEIIAITHRRDAYRPTG